MDIHNQAKHHLELLAQNPYPGRGIVLGEAPGADFLAQVYWIMGRSENSRNRIFVEDEKGFVRTKAFDESKMTDPSLIIYYPARHLDRCHIISNGDQTDTVFEAMQQGKTMEGALSLREYEPDAPNFTPRITGIMDMMENHSVYRLSILKTQFNQAEFGCLRQCFSYEKTVAGIGHCITTYAGDGNPLPSFSGEPWVAPIAETPEQTLDMYWSCLNSDNRVAMMVKWINRRDYSAKVYIRNRYPEAS